jgi:hypothetical protein
VLVPFILPKWPLFHCHRRRFHFHFTHTSGSWLNQVERWFGLITDKMIRRGTFHSVEELERATYAWLASWNDRPKAFVWKATTDVILGKVRPCKELAGTAHQAQGANSLSFGGAEGRRLFTY